jgi:CubicO group peptidase (beta-lactamase class C family)
MIMQLVEAGTIGLQQPISDYLPWFTPPQKMRPITVHDLLTHTSGLPIGPEGHLSGLLEAFTGAQLEPGSAPGGAPPTYSNLGYKALGYTVERLLRKSYAEAVGERIFEPLGMHASHGAVTEALRPWTAIGYQRVFTDRPPQRSHPLVQAPYEESDTGDGPIVSTVEDMCSYLRMFMRSGEPIVSGSSFDVMTRPHTAFLDPEHPGETYGYALEVYEEEGHRIVGHTGGMIAHTTYCFADVTAGIGVIVFGSADGTNPLGEYALRAAIDAHGGSHPRPAPAIDVRVPEAARLAGTWSAGERSIALVQDGDDLAAEVGGERAVVERRGDDAFLVAHPTLETFVFGIERPVRGGEIAALTHGPDRFERAGMAWNAPSSPTDAWRPLVGHYTARLPWAQHFRVIERAGHLYLVEYTTALESGASETELVPLPGGRAFRLGEEEWRPSRVRFGDTVDGRALSLHIDGAVYGRAFTP